MRTGVYLCLGLVLAFVRAFLINISPSRKGVKLKRVFISHPFTSDPTINKKRADYICKEIMSEDLNILPISPLHTFGFIEKSHPN